MRKVYLVRRFLPLLCFQDCQWERKFLEKERSGVDCRSLIRTFPSKPSSPAGQLGVECCNNLAPGLICSLPPSLPPSQPCNAQVWRNKRHGTRTFALAPWPLHPAAPTILIHVSCCEIFNYPSRPSVRDRTVPPRCCNYVFFNLQCKFRQRLLNVAATGPATVGGMPMAPPK